MSRSEQILDLDDDEASTDSGPLPAHQELRLNLERFGFAEFFAESSHDWRVAPPVLAATPLDRAHRAFVTGARSDLLIQRVRAALAPGDLRIDSIPNCPDCLSLCARDVADLRAIASASGLFLQLDAPTAVLAALTPVGGATLRCRVDIPIGKEWGFEHFRERELRWAASNRHDMERTSFGLFRLRFRYRTEVLLRFSGLTYDVPLQEAKFVALKRARSRVLKYEPEARILSVPAICRPPVLIERALLLCSGRLPEFEPRRDQPSVLHYRDVPRDVARTAAVLLHQGIL
jgi:hypothetical protein